MPSQLITMGLLPPDLNWNPVKKIKGWWTTKFTHRVDQDLESVLECNRCCFSKYFYFKNTSK